MTLSARLFQTFVLEPYWGAVETKTEEKLILYVGKMANQQDVSGNFARGKQEIHDGGKISEIRLVESPHQLVPSGVSNAESKQEACRPQDERGHEDGDDKRQVEKIENQGLENHRKDLLTTPNKGTVPKDDAIGKPKSRQRCTEQDDTTWASHQDEGSRDKTMIEIENTEAGANQRPQSTNSQTKT